jgi:hypothetical protein
MGVNDRLGACVVRTDTLSTEENRTAILASLTTTKTCARCLFWARPALRRASPQGPSGALQRAEDGVPWVSGSRVAGSELVLGENAGSEPRWGVGDSGVETPLRSGVGGSERRVLGISINTLESSCGLSSSVRT